ncbi:MAG: diguanylate cyclase [Oscillospiraceae bacterium]|nr:diguanylate cyclase [Oscillospiraceae bacterium]
MKSKKNLKFLLRGAMVIFIVIPVLLISIVGFASITSYSNTFGAETAGSISVSQTSGIVAVVDEYKSFLTAAAEFESVKQAVATGKDDTGEILSSYINNGFHVLDVIVTDAGGSILTGERKTQFFYDIEGMKTIAETKTPISNISMNNSVYGSNVFYCVRPVDEGAGYVILVADVKGIADYLLRTGSLVVFDDAGTAVNVGGREVVSFSDISNTIIRENVTKYKGRAIRDYESFEERSNFVNVGTITGTKWNWISAEPKSTAFSSGVSIFGLAMVPLLIATLINVLIMVLSTRRITNPLVEMIDKMGIIKGGKIDERFEVRGSNEFARMAEAFNVMLDEVSFSEGLHRTISDISDNMLFEWDFIKEKMYLSDNFKATFEISSSGAKLSNGKFLDSKMDEENSEKYKRDINRLLKNMDTIGSEYEVMTKSGKPMWISLRAHCVINRMGELVRVLGVLTNIDNEKQLSQQLEEKASYDFLSGLYNRNTFEKELDAELGSSASKRLAILFVDIDDFKFINDRFNHTIGDEAIKFVADKLNKIVEKGGFAGRFGGDEFVLCLTQKSHIEDVEQLSVDIIDDLYEGYFCEMANTQMNIRVSIGISLCPEHSSNGKTLVAQADEAMYFVKKNGKSNYHFFDPEDSNIIDMMHHT